MGVAVLSVVGFLIYAVGVYIYKFEDDEKSGRPLMRMGIVTMVVAGVLIILMIR